VIHETETPAAALPVIERTIAIHRKYGDPSSARIVRALGDKAELLRALGRLPEATSAFEEAIDLAQEGHHEEPGVLFDQIVGLGLTDLDAGRFQEAVEHLERAFELAPSSTVPPVNRAEMEFALGRALWATHGDRDRAVALAQGARRTFIAHRATRLQHEADVWLDVHVLRRKRPARN
jgi:tetratricopeptide (TPR) repeat protein